MRIWDFITSGTETVKRNTSDLVTPLKNVCKRSYDYCTAAVKKIDDVVRVNGLQKLPDEEGRAKIVNFSTKFVKNASAYAVKEAANIIPGGRAVTQIYSQTVRELEIDSKKDQNTSCDKEITGNSSKDTTGPDPLENRELKLGSENRVQADSFAHQTPENVLRVSGVAQPYREPKAKL